MVYWDGSVKVELKIFIDHHFRTQLSLYSKLYSKTKYDIGLSPYHKVSLLTLLIRSV